MNKRCAADGDGQLKQTQSARFIELANPDLGLGESDWVCFEEHPELSTSNGSGWSRGDVVRHGGRSYVVEKERKGKGETGKIVAMRCVRYSDSARSDSANFAVPTHVKAHFKGHRCVQTLAREIEVDHKNGRYDADATDADDFQPLCRSSNLVKRAECKKCRNSGSRFDARDLGFPIGWIEGGELFEKPRGCHGCYLHDIKRFNRGAWGAGGL